MRIKSTVIGLLITCTVAWAANSYIISTAIIMPDVVSMPPKGGTHTDTTTGATWTRRSDVSEMGGATDGMIVYSRYSPSNSNGQYLLVHGTNSTSCYVYRLSDNVMIADLKRDATHQIGELHEIRWDYTGNYPNRVYFVYATGFYYMDVVASNGSPTLIRDFSSDFPTASKIINDVEGDSSADSRYWAWEVLGPYDGSNYPVIAFISYDKLNNQILGVLEPGDVTPTQNASNWTTKFPEPNMVEISPNGDRIMLNYARSYTGGVTQDFAETVFDGAWVFNLDFTNPVKVGITSTHSGWGFKDGKQLFVHHMNRTQGSVSDTIQACYTDGTGGVYPNNCFNILKLADYNYLGQHLTRMPSSKPGWILMGTYQDPQVPIARNTAYVAYSGTFYTPDGVNQYSCVVSGTTGSVEPTFPSTSYGQTVVDGGVTWYYRGKMFLDDQLAMVELKDMTENPRIWRVSPGYNEYDGGYRDEFSAAISQDGNKIYVTGNWGDASTGHGESFEIDITGWGEYFGISSPPNLAGITISTGGGISIAPAVTGGASIGVVQ